MLNLTEALVIAKSSVPTSLEAAIKVIQYYIYKRTGNEISIKHPSLESSTIFVQLRCQQIVQTYTIACSFLLTLGEQGEEKCNVKLYPDL
jgi:hypothetical protein